MLIPKHRRHSCGRTGEADESLRPVRGTAGRDCQYNYEINDTKLKLGVCTDSEESGSFFRPACQMWNSPGTGHLSPGAAIVSENTFFDKNPLAGPLSESVCLSE
jgi:hypothetical protein